MSKNLLRVVFLDRGTLVLSVALRPLSQAHELVSYDATPPELMAERITAADIVITNKVPPPAEVLTAAKRLQLIAVAAAGTDIVDLAACAARGTD